MDVSPPCSSIPFHPSGASGIPREVFRRLRMSPGLRSWISFRFLERAAGAGCAPRPRDGYRRVAVRSPWDLCRISRYPRGRFMEFAWVFGYMCDVISAMSRKLFPLFVAAIG